MRSAFRVSIETLSASPLRTFLSTLGIVIGVASLVAVLSLGDGMEQFIRAEIGSSTDLQLLKISPRTSREIDGTPLPRPDTIRFTEGDVRSLRASLGDSAVVGLTASGVTVAVANARQRAVRIVGVSAALFGVLDLQVASGRFFSDADGDAPLLLLSRKAARELAPAGRAPLAPGDSVRLGGADYAIAGILGGDQTDKAMAAVMPMTGAGQVVESAGGQWLPAMVVRAATLEGVTPARERAERWLATRYGAAWKERAIVANRAGLLANAQRGMLLFKLFMGSITGISKLVGGIGVMNVLLAAVAERTREIGVRRAVGAARGHILAQFLAEAVTISGLGSVVGIVLGLGGAYGITAVLRAQTEARVYAGISANTLLVAVGATVVVGLSFGLYPALRASRLSPVDAMRHE